MDHFTIWIRWVLFILFDRRNSIEKINSIAEPYAMYKKCPYGCLILFFIVILIPPYFNPIVRYIDRRTVHDVISISSGL